MANGKIIKYKRHYKITIEGQTDTKNPEDEPMYLNIFGKTIEQMVEYLDAQTLWNTVTVKEVKR